MNERDVIAAIESEGGKASLLGGRAVTAICGPALPAALRRESLDIDVVIRGKDRKALKAGMAKLRCEPVTEFNLLNGKERMIFYADETKIDVFIDVFRMCHVLHLGDWVGACPLTLPAAELALTKLQVVRAERKDFSDLSAILVCCPLGAKTPNGLDGDRLAKLLGADWGLWRTATGTLTALRGQAPAICGEGALLGELLNAIDALEAKIAAAPKTMAWKMRSVIGDRTSWYELPEEPEV